VDHFYLQRIADPVTGELLGVDMSGSKIGGPVEGATVYVPDPMGASGSTVRHVIRHYHDSVEGRERRIIACHLMVTPEYLRQTTTEFPDVLVYALRVDRGLSPPDVLETPLGERWDEERGLNDHAYIVPGAGGMGEVINNSFV
ncbi:MAG: uracil phosphoribosyltransferase, partial [Deltaproteobacteria bacterium]|nr:uracil phosphoribosyltransferase [Deltaproteobacteria bacterium]